MSFALHGGAALNSFKKLTTAGAEAEPGGAEADGYLAIAGTATMAVFLSPRRLTQRLNLRHNERPRNLPLNEDEYRRKESPTERG